MRFPGIVADNIAKLYRMAAEKFGDAPAYATRLGKGKWAMTSYRELYEAGLNLGTALIELGVGPKGHVGLLADNRVEWNMVDFATLLIGAADVPRGTDITSLEIEFILSHSDATIVFVENKRMLDRVIRLMPKLEKVERVVLMDPQAEAPNGVLHLYQLIERGKELREAGDRRVEERMDGIQETDLFTIIYTSGTTGAPKGVQLTHANMASQVRNLPFPLSTSDRLLSILPVWHSYERVFHSLAASNGCCTYFTSLRTIADDLRDVKPTIMASAPRLWESLYQRILKNVHDAKPLNRALFHTAYFCSRMVRGSQFFLSGQKLDMVGRTRWQNFKLGSCAVGKIAVFYLPYALLNVVVLKKLRAVMGGCFKGTVSGGGALQPHVDEFFNYIGIPVKEGYGLTETTPVVAVRSPGTMVIGTVGCLFDETEIRIVAAESGEILFPNGKFKGEGRGLKGEIHIKGPQVMLGYYKNPEATKKVMLEDGWFRSGDLGAYTFNDCLKIMGRLKDTIVLLNGENIEPIPIEAKLCESSLIEQCMVVGQDEKHLGALIVPSLDGFREAGIAAESLEALVANPQVKRMIHAESKQFISAQNGFKKFEHVLGCKLLTKPFEVGDEMTNTFKIKRHIVGEKYAAEIKSLFRS